MADFRNRDANVLAYAIFLTVLAMGLWYLYLSKSEILFENLRFQTYDSKMSKNLSAKADAAFAWSIAANSSGWGFSSARKCPENVVFSGTVEGSSIEAVPAEAAVLSGNLACVATPSSGIPFVLEYSEDFSTFSTGSYSNSLDMNPSRSAQTLSGTFSDPDATFVSFWLPPDFSEFDSNLDSDDFRTWSTGSIAYPSGYFDDDASARTGVVGMVRFWAGWQNAFWNSPKTLATIGKNPHNADPPFIRLGEVSEGYLRISADGTFSVRVVEFDTGALAEAGQLVAIASEERAGIASGTGYLQNDLSLSGSRASGDGAKPFDFQNRSFAVFFSYPEGASEGRTHLKYSLGVETATGALAYVAAIDDSRPETIRFHGVDVIVDPAGSYRSKSLDFSVPKPGLPNPPACEWTWGWPIEWACIVPE